MKVKLTHPWLKAFAGLTINLSAGWYGAVLILPNFSPIKTTADFLTLIYDLLFGTIFLVLSVWCEKNLEL